MAQEKLKTVKKIPQNGMILFSGVVRSINGKDEVEICDIVVPPLPVKENRYSCGKSFEIQMAEELFDIHKKYGYVVISNEHTVLATLKGTEKKILRKVHGDLATETKRGGQSANRIARIRQEKRDAYKNKIVDSCLLFPDNVEGVIIGGNAQLPTEVLDQIKNDTRLLFPVLGFVKTSSTNTNISLDEAIKNSESIILGEVTKEERDWVEEVQNLINNDPEKVVFGEALIRKCDEEYILAYVLMKKNRDAHFNAEKREIIHSRFLDDYQGMIGVLYYSGQSEYLN